MSPTTQTMPEFSFRPSFPFSVWATLPNGNGTFVGKAEAGQIVTVPACRHWRVEAHLTTDEELARCINDLARFPIPEISITATHDRFVSMLGNERMLANRLQTLDLSGKHISDAATAHAGALNGLTNLSITACDGMTDEGLAHVSKLPSLNKLTIGICNGMTDEGLAHVSKLPSLNKLTIGTCNGLKQSNLSGPAGLARVSFIDCANLTQVVLRDLPALWDLFVWDCPGLGAAGTLRMQNCGSLEHAQVGFVPLTDEVFADIFGKTLRGLTLWRTAVTDKSIACLGSMPNLEGLALGENQKITAQGLSRMEALTSLKTLYLEPFGGMGAEELDSLALPSNLQRVVLVGLRMTDETLPLLKKFSGVERFRLEKCRGLTPERWERLQQDWPGSSFHGDTIVLKGGLTRLRT
jgi:Leucine-rich repeat (LRR) protein